MNVFEKVKQKIGNILGRSNAVELNGGVPGMANQGYEPSELNDIRPPPFYSLKRLSISGSGRKSSVMERAPNIEHYRLDAATLANTMTRPTLKDLHQEKAVSAADRKHSMDQQVRKV